MTELVKSLKKCRVEGNTVYLPKELLTNYQDVRKALINAGGKYKRNTFVFNTNAQPFMDRLTGGENVNIKKEFQFFATPEKLADELVDLADLKPTDNVFEPSAGDGAIIRAIHRKFPKMRVEYCEIMPENIEILKQIKYASFQHADFLSPIMDMHAGFYDKIIANPPFSKNQDIDHILKMYKLLAPGGRLVSIASLHWKFSKGKKERDFKNWLEEVVHAKVLDIEEGAFKESGTMVGACIIVINKK